MAKFRPAGGGLLSLYNDQIPSSKWRGKAKFTRWSYRYLYKLSLAYRCRFELALPSLVCNALFPTFHALSSCLLSLRLSLRESFFFHVSFDTLISGSVLADAVSAVLLPALQLVYPIRTYGIYLEYEESLMEYSYSLEVLTTKRIRKMIPCTTDPCTPCFISDSTLTTKLDGIVLSWVSTE